MVVLYSDKPIKELEEITEKQIAPLFDKLNEKTKNGEIEWNSTTKSCYETYITIEHSERWYIKILKDQNILMIEWIDRNCKDKSKYYPEHTKFLRVRFYNLNYSYMKLIERITICPELLSDLIKLL